MRAKNHKNLPDQEAQRAGAEPIPAPRTERNRPREFDPDGVGIASGSYFGMPFTPDEAALVILSVPWDVTSSYGGGSAGAPEAIVAASTQLDFYDPWAPGEWRKGIATLPPEEHLAEKSASLRLDAREIIAAQEAGASLDEIARADDLSSKLHRINAASGELNARVRATAAGHLAKGRLVGLVGGDHATPLGLIAAVAHHEGSIGVLHLDAHLDLRPAYEGFEHSHASIMFNVLGQVPGVEKLVQAGARDFSESELRYAAHHPKIELFTAADLAGGKFAGESWESQCTRIVEALPRKVYVSFDIDALSPDLCPGTGTPVPGGFSFDEAAWLLRRVVDSGRRIVGFDLCEVAPRPDEGDQWDANVGARVLLRLCGQTLRGSGAATAANSPDNTLKKATSTDLK